MGRRGLIHMGLCSRISRCVLDFFWEWFKWWKWDFCILGTQIARAHTHTHTRDTKEVQAAV